MKKSVVYLFMSLLALFQGCEYGLEDNFVEMDVPSKELKMDISLGLNENDEGQLMVTDAYLIDYEVKVAGFVVRRCVFGMGGTTWEEEGSRGSFVIDPKLFPNNVYELSCEVYGKRGDGSVYDQAGDELLGGKQTWQVRVLTIDPSDRQLPYRVDEEGYLEVSWEKDENLRASFDHYKLIISRNHYNLVQTIKKFDICSYVDDWYAGGDASYEVYYYPKEVTGRPRSLGRLELKQIDPGIEVTYPVSGKARFTWNTPYRSAVDVVYRGNVVAENVKDGSVEFPIVPFEGATDKAEFIFHAFDGNYLETNFSVTVFFDHKSK